MAKISYIDATCIYEGATAPSVAELSQAGTGGQGARGRRVARPRGVSGPQAQGALGRPAPARGHGPRIVREPRVFLMDEFGVKIVVGYPL